MRSPDGRLQRTLKAGYVAASARHFGRSTASSRAPASRCGLEPHRGPPAHQRSRAELQVALALRDPDHFREFYVKAALAAGVIEMTLPDTRSSKQRYRLTDAGTAGGEGRAMIAPSPP